MSDPIDPVDLVRAARSRIEAERLAGVEALPLRIPPFHGASRPRRPAAAPVPSQARTKPAAAAPSVPPAWPKRGVRPSQDPNKMPKPLPPRAVERFEALKALEAHIGDCARCKLAYDRTCLVFGVGNPDADLMFVGEGPGYDEDQTGEPFVGRAGKMLTDIVENVLKLSRRDVYIANVVKCRPPQNRVPQPDEVAACSPFLRRQIETIQPRVIAALGAPAAKCLMSTQEGISALRGRFTQEHGAHVMPTYHPAYLLRKPQDKRKVYDDMLKVRRLLDELGPKPPA